MADIVENLRSLSRYEHADLSVGDEAANEIDRLRAALNTARIMDNYKSARSAALSQIWALMGVADHESALSRLAKLEAVAEAARDALAFLKGIEGSGYGGTSEYDVLVVNLGHGLAALDGEKGDG